MPTLRLTAKEGSDYDVELTDQELALYKVARNSGHLHVQVDEQKQVFTMSSQSSLGNLGTIAGGPAKPATVGS